MYLADVSVRHVEDINEALGWIKVSPGTISNPNKKAYMNMKHLFKAEEDWMYDIMVGWLSDTKR